jgi:glutamine amidotransferase
MSAPEVTVIDYGVGNLLSVQRGLEHCGAIVTVSADPKQILNARRVVLPGVGAFGSAMQALERLELVNVIREIGHRKTPLLGICLGMQLLLEESEEFCTSAGLGLIPGRVIRVPNQDLSGNQIKIPHIGWSALWPSNVSLGWRDTLMKDNQVGETAYFVHSFMALPSNPAHCIADCLYGGRRVSATIGRDNITGCQFHPEKSGDVGLKILRQFILQ